MNKNQKILLLFIGFCMFIVVGLIGFNVLMPKPEIKPDEVQVMERSVQEETVDHKIPDIKDNAKEFVNVYFIGKNEHNEEVYKAVKRHYNKEVDGSKIKFAVTSLIRGPKSEEKNFGVYTEIPSGAEVISISEQSDKVIVNLNSAFVTGGGTESLYKRLYQLIKTVKLNSSLPVYLYIDGQRADVVGGEGIMLSQPLSNSSLEN
ncbi:MAG: GerMN domain-containing protein [Candidatus Gastranaerophilales bacterium]|nr:GerMN domain-containing protein [Candidatus Gastranaerophilales bacterium]